MPAYVSVYNGRRRRVLRLISHHGCAGPILKRRRDGDEGLSEEIRCLAWSAIEYVVVRFGEVSDNNVLNNSVLNDSRHCFSDGTVV